MNPTAKEFVPKWVQVSPMVRPTNKFRYTKETMKTLQLKVEDSIRHGPVTDFPPFKAIPQSLQYYLTLHHYIEFIDIDHATAVVEGSSALNNDPAMNYYCVQCSKGPNPCSAIGDIIVNIRRREKENILGAFLFQPGRVVMGLIEMLLVFESKKSSLRIRMLKEKAPKAIQLVKEFLCGEGFHIPPPAVTAHEQWRILMQKLKFDFIRDSRTIIFTELSKYWKKSHTQFEQFAHFFHYRDDIPTHRTKNMITHSQKPVLVAALSGDVDALVMLSELGFFVPPDYYWTFPFFKEANRDEKIFSVLRHLCVYYYQRQSERNNGNDGGSSPVQRPISPPSLRPSPAFKPRTALEAVVGCPADVQLKPATCSVAEVTSQQH